MIRETVTENIAPTQKIWLTKGYKSFANRKRTPAQFCL